MSKYLLTTPLLHLVMFTCHTVLPSQLYSDWHDRKAEGWAWYEDKSESREKKESEKDPTETMQKVRKNLEEKLSQAILNPNQENVLAYMQEQKKWVERSSDFANIWAQLLLSNPYLDNSAAGRPVSQYGLQLHKQATQKKKEKLIASLAKNYGLFFFYEGNNEASGFFGRIVQQFSQKYEFETVAISTDGTYIERFREARKDNGITKTLNVDLCPALYLIDPKRDIAVPISFGFVAMDQIESNIALQFESSSEES